MELQLRRAHEVVEDEAEEIVTQIRRLTASIEAAVEAEAEEEEVVAVATATTILMPALGGHRGAASVRS